MAGNLPRLPHLLIVNGDYLESDELYQKNLEILQAQQQGAKFSIESDYAFEDGELYDGELYYAIVKVENVGVMPLPMFLKNIGARSSTTLYILNKKMYSTGLPEFRKIRGTYSIDSLHTGAKVISKVEHFRLYIELLSETSLLASNVSD